MLLPDDDAAEHRLRPLKASLMPEAHQGECKGNRRLHLLDSFLCYVASDVHCSSWNMCADVCTSRGREEFQVPIFVCPRNEHAPRPCMLRFLFLFMQHFLCLPLPEQ